MKPEPRKIDEIERDQLASPFGRDLGLIHEVLVAVRNNENVGRAFWQLLHESGEALTRAVEAALTFPTQTISLKKALLPIDRLIAECAVSTPGMIYGSNAYDVRVRGEIKVDEGEIGYDEDTLPVSLYRVPRDTTIRAISHQLAGLHYRPARLAETLIYAAENRKVDFFNEGYILCLQDVTVDGKDVKVYIWKSSGYRVGGDRRGIDTQEGNEIKLGDRSLYIPCVKLHRKKK